MLLVVELLAATLLLVVELLAATVLLVVELLAATVLLVVEEPKVVADDPSSAQAEMRATSAISRAASKRNMHCDRSDVLHSDDVAVA